MQRLYTVPVHNLADVFTKGLKDLFRTTTETRIDVADADGNKLPLILTVERSGDARFRFGFGYPKSEVHIHCQYAEFVSEDRTSGICALDDVFPRLKMRAVHDTRLIEAVNDVKKKVADEIATVKSEIAAIKDLMIEALAKYEWHRDVQRAIAENKLSLSE